MHVVIIIIRVISPPPITSRVFNVRATGVAHGWRSQTAYTADESRKNSERKEMNVHTMVERKTPVAEQNKLTSIRFRRPTLAKSCL